MGDRSGVRLEGASGVPTKTERGQILATELTHLVIQGFSIPLEEETCRLRSEENVVSFAISNVKRE